MLTWDFAYFLILVRFFYIILNFGVFKENIKQIYIFLLFFYFLFYLVFFYFFIFLEIIKTLAQPLRGN